MSIDNTQVSNTVGMPGVECTNHVSFHLWSSGEITRAGVIEDADGKPASWLGVGTPDGDKVVAVLEITVGPDLSEAGGLKITKLARDTTEKK